MLGREVEPGTPEHLHVAATDGRPDGGIARRMTNQAENLIRGHVNTSYLQPFCLTGTRTLSGFVSLHKEVKWRWSASAPPRRTRGAVRSAPRSRAPPRRPARGRARRRERS